MRTLTLISIAVWLMDFHPIHLPLKYDVRIFHTLFWSFFSFFAPRCFPLCELLKSTGLINIFVLGCNPYDMCQDKSASFNQVTETVTSTGQCILHVSSWHQVNILIPFSHPSLCYPLSEMIGWESQTWRYQGGENKLETFSIPICSLLSNSLEGYIYEINPDWIAQIRTQL